MTRLQNKKMQISLCKCGQAFRGSNLRIHLSSANVGKDVEAGIEHGLYTRSYFCAHHKVFAEEGDEGSKLFHSQHSSCLDGNLRLSKKEMKFILLSKEEKEKEEKEKKEKEEKEEKEKKEKEEKEEKEKVEKVEEKEKKEKVEKRKEVEVDLDKSETAIATDFLVKLNKRSAEVAEVDEDLSFPPLKRRLIRFESDSEDEFRPLATSTPIEEEEKKKAKEEEEKKKAEEEEERKKVEEEKKKAKEILLEERAEARRKEFQAKNSIRRQREWERENAVVISQDRAFDDLNRRLANMKSARDKALDQLEELQAKVQMSNRWELQVAALLVEKKEWGAKEGKLKDEVTAEKKKRSEAEKKAQDAEKKAQDVEKKAQDVEKKAEKQVQEEKAKRERELNISYDLRKELEAAKQRELALLQRLEALEESSSSSSGGGKGSTRFIGHLACVNGRIAKSYVEKEDLNKSILCYDDPANGVNCHHITIVQEDGSIASVRHRNTRRLSID